MSDGFLPSWDEQEVSGMSQSDVFGRKRLTVLNQSVADDVPSRYVLEDEGLSPATSIEPSTLEKQVIAGLRSIYDPEIPLNIYDLGLVYRVNVTPERRVEIDMTLTSPGCPVAGVLVRQAHDLVRKISGAAVVRTELVWDPPWDRSRMSDAARLALGLL
ncbi:MAG: iron-sulfur cluster assembly protein [Myxococcales bacterium]